MFTLSNRVFICSKCAGDNLVCLSSTGPGTIPLHSTILLHICGFTKPGENSHIQNELVTIKIIPAVKITGANQIQPMSSNEYVPDQCSSRSKIEVEQEQDTEAAPVSPSTRKSECLEDIQRLTDEELEFDEFLMDAAEWL
mmetsp:Transcript_90/g.141  ORF Transcript_90/g.141 Transcript_90/m.141 type:complete len:140 (-) Transcript_90:165-584(-)